MTSVEREPIVVAVAIASSLDAVWRALTEPALMAHWMGDPEMDVHVAMEPVVGGPFVVTATHHGRHASYGRVLKFAPRERFAYTHRADISRLPDAPESDSTIDFALARDGERTAVTITVSGFPTEAIYRHLALYWRGTGPVLARFVESGLRPAPAVAG